MFICKLKIIAQNINITYDITLFVNFDLIL